MNIKKWLMLLLMPLFPLFLPQIGHAATVVNTFQITTDGAQQKDAIIYKNLIAYTNFGGNQGIDVWGYDIESQDNFALVERPGDQFLTGHFGKYIVYEDYDGVDYNTRLFNKNTGEDTLIAGGAGSQGGGVTNGKVVAYIDGSACGSIHAYNIKDETDTVISPTGCQPLRISGDIVVWPYAAPGGSNIYGYNLDEGELLDIADYDNFQESANIFEYKVVWYEYIGGGYGDYQAIKVKNLKTGEIQTIYETYTDSLQNPAISNRYVVWSQSPSLHINKVMGADLKTGEVFEIQPEGPHQNSHTSPSIWKNMATWMSFRTGNGDIYGSEFTKP